jgi:hypothetical protein
LDATPAHRDAEGRSPARPSRRGRDRRHLRPTVLRSRGVCVDTGTATGGQYRSAAGSPNTITRVITTGGMPGWQITLIALGAALVAAAAAVILDRTLARRRLVSAKTA